jgi:hypothetical chaperone protein
VSFVGIDFGTTNSAVAQCDANGVATLVHLRSGDTMRTALHFDANERGPDRKPWCTAGDQAIDAYLAGAGDGRFVQSFKSYLASKTFTSTNIFGFVYTLEDLIALFVAGLRATAMASGVELSTRVVVGRPVHFVRDDTDDGEGDALAQERLRRAIVAAGFDDVSFEFEPVAAAWRYEQRLQHDELVLIADFGGGTTDLCLVNVGPTARKNGKRRVVATDGVGLAGDVFDQRIIQHVVAPRLGMGSTYRLMVGETDVPLWLYAHLASWHRLSFLKSKKTERLLENILLTANDRVGVAAFKQVIDEDLGYRLHQAVERTKIALSRAEHAQLTFDELDLDVAVERADFERWIAPDVARIDEALVRILKNVSLTADDVDRVFMTGGTSLVPAVRDAFARRFGEAKLTGGEELTSVAAGLALAARDAHR